MIFVQNEPLPCFKIDIHTEDSDQPLFIRDLKYIIVDLLSAVRVSSFGTEKILFMCLFYGKNHFNCIISQT